VCVCVCVWLARCGWTYWAIELIGDSITAIISPHPVASMYIRCVIIIILIIIHHHPHILALVPHID
jgi:hypothetical protein